MLTIVCEQPGRLNSRDRPMPVRRDGDVLVKIGRIGVCGTDLHIFAGNQPYLNYPRVMGHELSGTVEAVPDGSTLAVGDTVYVIPYLSCGTCRACRRGQTNCCATLQVLGVHCDGGMTEYLSLPERFVRAAPGVSLDAAAMVEFLAIGAHAVRRSRCGEGDGVLVTGAGPIGMAVALFAGLRGAEVTLLDPRQDRLRFCQAHLPVAATVAVGEGDVAALERITEGVSFDVVFDATGSPAAMERGFGFVGQGGTYVLVSIVAGDIRFSDPEFHKRETSLLASRNATPEDFDTVLDAIRAGRVPTDAFATHRMALSEVPDHFPTLLDPSAGVIKALLHV
ncbi:zinc-binding alcohol dehydrogenase family protein [Lichenihabitans sp. Uapishka_5]|uniref:zinc-binding alcohol dehydrogenase family protein n=1 Tax=Lichenihabitans sp. Uapishka_5 TaxID=3037302 RepID=UPI0029E7DC8C|nr:zinc-binding alcohol dehydrogenase family protein [Lichenihabitans sp. Uapishka_5]MDX7951216.1 zinc-binding alcohol dehydrogenase family protein [Lichenihabitans sp. Uapishka_5]